MMILFIASFLSAGWKRVMGSSSAPLAPEKEVMKSDTLGVFIRTTVFGFNEQDTTVDNKDFKRITIPEELIDWDTINAGKPQIPYIRLLIAVPDSCDFNITVYESDYILLEDYLIYPIPRIVFEEDTFGCFGSREVYTYDTTFYQKDTLYPDKFYEVNSDGHWRDQRVLEVFLYPVQFNPQQKLMYFYNGLDLRIEYTGTVVENENGLGPFEDIGRETLLNYPGIERELPQRDPPEVHYYTDLLNTDNIADYIIVTHQDFLETVIDSSWIQEFAEWRVKHNQFDVGIVKISDIFSYWPPADSDSLHIPLKDFLIYAYDNWDANSVTDGHFSYCLFIGDWDYVPTKLYEYHYPVRLGANEFYFADPNPGSEADIMLGRWPVRANTQDLNIIAQKTINYEQLPTLGDWRRNGLLITGVDSDYGHYETEIEESKPYLSDIGYDTLIVRGSQLTEDEYRDSITYYLNLGEILTVYYDHGGKSCWQRYHSELLMGLENEDMLPVVLSMACLTASFQWGTDQKCFGEHFIFKEGGGCIAFYGATKLTYRDSFNNALRILNTMLRYQNWIIGTCLVNLFHLKSDYCLLGDPALDLGDYTACPDLPDLVVRPQGIDISLLPPYPYPHSGDIIPIRAKVFNIGGAVTTRTVDVNFIIVLDQDTLYDTTVRIDPIQPRNSVEITVYWNTGLTHPDYYGEIGDCEFIVIADPDDEIRESWEYNNTSSITKKIALYPNEPGWPKEVTGITQPAIANLDATGSVEIVCAGLDSVYVFDPEGNLVLPWPKYFKNVYGIVLGDIDNNDSIDIVAVSPESIKVYDYQGNMLNGWPVQIEHEDYQFTGLPALGRIESGVSNVFNIVVAAKTGPDAPPMPAPMKIFVYDRQGSGVFEFNTSAQVPQGLQSYGVSIENIVSEGNNEIVISYSDAQNQLFKTELFNYNDSVAIFDYGNDRMVSALVDLNNDNYADVITGGEDGKIRAYDVEDNQLLWERQTEGPINCSPAVGDIHPLEEGVEVTFGNDTSRVHLLCGIDGDAIFPWPYIIDTTRVRISPAVADINGDGDLDIIIGDNTNYIYAFKHTMEAISPFPLPLFGTLSSPIIGDIDGDRKSEVILSSSDGYLHVWENMDSKVLPYLLEWPQFHHDHQRTGLYDW
jgi:WD40 repeat protein